MTLPDEFQPGQARPTARDLNQILAELRRLGKVSAAPPLYVQEDGAGFRFDLGEPQVLTIKIGTSGSGGKYAWTEQVATVGGTWTAGVRSGTTTVDPAYEANANATVPTGTIVLRAVRDRLTGELRFERGAC